MDNQNDNLQELEVLRQQVAEFKNRMDEQEIVNRKLLMAATTKGHISWIKQLNIGGAIINIVMIPIVILVFRNIVGCSWGPILFCELILILSAAFGIWNISTIRDKYLLCDNVLSVKQRLTAFRRREKLSFFIVLPILLLWIVWILFDIYYGTNIPLPSTTHLIEDALIILIGLSFVFYTFYREKRTLNKTIKEIDEFVELK